ncbi:uncharacterized protein LAJ45_06177 [Morchella importuna]|uniref:uncharacterized protein n=1 Tax=Morchella importuna TaxID=1174673 RepID=UPI001E8E143B|nr:uncharacterized protein LAJ45_06177 [Morchella importuna]KAH8149549.1 hypothetical protein LAJ45_06177 [Morchella importuna]
MDQLELGLQDILDACQNLIVYDEKLDTVRFAHFSVQEYLRRHPEFGTEIGHKRMAEICLKSFTYEYDTEVERLYLPYDLRRYTTFHWASHVRLSGLQGVEVCMAFFNHSAAYDRWIAMRAKELGLGIPSIPSLLWVACKYGLQPIVELLLQDMSPMSIGSPCVEYEEITPLMCATTGNQIEIARMLLAVEGVDVNQQGSGEATPLWRAAEGGHVEIVRMLLAVEEMDLNKSDSSGDTPLLIALRSRHRTITRLLRQALEPNINPNPTV